MPVTGRHAVCCVRVTRAEISRNCMRVAQRWCLTVARDGSKSGYRIGGVPHVWSKVKRVDVHWQAAGGCIERRYFVSQTACQRSNESVYISVTDRPDCREERVGEQNCTGPRLLRLNHKVSKHNYGSAVIRGIVSRRPEAYLVRVRVVELNTLFDQSVHIRRLDLRIALGAMPTSIRPAEVVGCARRLSHAPARVSEGCRHERVGPYSEMVSIGSYDEHEASVGSQGAGPPTQAPRCMTMLGLTPAAGSRAATPGIIRQPAARDVKMNGIVERFSDRSLKVALQMV